MASGDNFYHGYGKHDWIALGPGPSWLQSAPAPDQPAISLGKVMDAVTNLLEFSALCFYFFGDNRTSHAHTALMFVS